MSDSRTPAPAAAPSVTEDVVLTVIERMAGEHAISAIPLPGGMIADVRKVTLADGRVLVSKYRVGDDAHLDIEGRMIEHLGGSGIDCIPHVLFAAPELLLQEFMPGSHTTRLADASLGRLLARLHDVQGPAHGFDGPTLNGEFLLPNGWWTSWIDHFRQQRLIFAADAAVANGSLAATSRARIDVLSTRLDDLITEPPFASLMHGDVWASNVLAAGSDVIALLDPSTEYGNPELELSYAIGSGLGPEFVKAYTATRPIDEEFFTLRRWVYATYPAIMHVYYFGSRYEGRLDEALTRSGV
jgi:fructosamine-3-kinase